MKCYDCVTYSACFLVGELESCELELCGDYVSTHDVSSCEECACDECTDEAHSLYSCDDCGSPYLSRFGAEFCDRCFYEITQGLNPVQLTLVKKRQLESGLRSAKLQRENLLRSDHTPDTLMSLGELARFIDSIENALDNL